MDRFTQTARTTLKRLATRGIFDRDKVYKILDEGFVCHVGFIVDGGPVVIPTGYGRIGDNVLIHGSAASRMLQTIAGDIEICVTVTLIDGLVLARSAFHHSMNYRSVMMFGTACVVQRTSEKLEALRAISEHIIPGRWDEIRQPNDKELKATMVLRLPLVEVSAKVRSGPPIDDEADYELPTWAGEVPLRLVAEPPIPDGKLSSRVSVPPYIAAYFPGDPHLQAIEVRPATPKDAELIASVLEKAFAEYRELYTQEGFSATVISKLEVEHRMREGPLWVVMLNGEIVGTVAAVSKGEALHIRGMGIVPEARGKRIGEKLLKYAEAFAIDHGYKRLTLSTTPFLNRAIRLYERFGFQRSEGGPSDLFGTPLFTMTKSLIS